MLAPSPKTMTTALSVRCQQCGAPLQVSDALRFVTCGYCHAELEVVRDATTIHTQILDKIKAATSALSDRLKVLELQNDLDKLDREWEAWRQKNLDRNKDGSLFEPGPPRTGPDILRLSAFVCILSTVIAAALGGPFWALVAGPLMGAAAWLVGNQQNVDALTYRSSFERYRKLRVSLLRQLESARAEPRVAA